MATTPPGRLLPKRKYTEDEKEQLLSHLDLEVERRIRSFQSTLTSALHNFRIRHEGQVSRVPRVVRGLSMAQFVDKYGGDMNACLRDLHGPEPVTGDKESRKRKWIAALEEQDEHAPSSSKTSKLISSPKKTLQQHRAAKTPLRGKSKRPAATTQQTPTQNRVPSASSFNPSLKNVIPYPSLHSRTNSEQSLDDPLRRTGSFIVRRDPSVATTSGLSRAPSRVVSSSSQEAPHATSSQPSVVVSVSTKDGHVLEFDPLLASPGELDRLDGITDSAKKETKDEMRRLVSAALAKWTL